MNKKDNHPLINEESSHYAMFDDVQAIERFEEMFSIEELMAWAKLNSFKYRFRVGNKGDSVDWISDIKKIQTYEAYYKYLQDKLKSSHTYE